MLNEVKPHHNNRRSVFCLTFPFSSCCESINPDLALAYQLVNEIHSSEQALEQAVLCAKKMSKYPQVSFQNTKRAINKPMIEALLHIAEESKNTHKACFAKKSAEQHFIKILGEKY